ncbi:MAG TPA: dTMP kinase [Planctomycetota bacterium]
MRGKFIVFEGIDGSGKSSVSAKIEERLKSSGRRVLRTREPGGTPIGEKVRAVLLDPANAEMVPWTELFLYMASRAQLVDQVIRPALKEGVDVLCDRYYYSTAAYQGAAGKVGIPVVLKLAEEVAKFQRPDLVLLFDVPPQVARQRAGDRRDRVESKGEAYQERVRRGFLKMAKADRRFTVLDASRPADEVFEAARKAVDRVL